ncbi:MAG TPA: helix-turn-helix domain-containing protein [Ktedonobacteraceae bacterium]|nr:helix-turn-helix domain-containing protein [Ktedonobacteraceae bacterium]
MQRWWPEARDGELVEEIAKDLDCSPQTVRRRLHRFDVEGIEGLGDRPRPGRPRRLTAEDDSRIVALARSAPPRKLERLSSGELDVRDEQGRRIGVSMPWRMQPKKQATRLKRSQVRRISSTSSFRKGRAGTSQQEGWWRLFRRDAFAGQSFANPSEIDLARRMATV